MRCTCGALPPSDAQFCHRCGRPMVEFPQIESLDNQPSTSTTSAVQTTSPSPEVVISEQPSGWSGNHGIRSALLGAFLAMSVFFLPGINLVAPIISPLLCGLLTVWFYIRRTGDRLSVREGARLGTMSGLFAFVLVMIQFTVVMLALKDDKMRAEWEKQMGVILQDPQQASQAIEMLFSPMIFLVLALILGLFTFLPTLSGAAMAAWRNRRSL
jgi:hypothetical protein